MTHGYHSPNTDLSGAVLLDQDLRESLGDPTREVHEDVLLPLEGRHAPTFAVEVALGDRFDCEKDPEGLPYTTFSVGAVYKALDNAYGGRFTARPSFLIARVQAPAFPTVLVDPSEKKPVEIEYMIIPPAAGHRNKAVTLPVEYRPKLVAGRGRYTPTRVELTKNGRKVSLNGNNPFFVPPSESRGGSMKDNGYKGSIGAGRLGTR